MLISTHASAGFWDGTKLFQFIEKDVRGGTDYESGAATGYIVGVIDVSQGVLVCVPAGESGVSMKQLKQIAYNYMQKHPELWNQSADISVISAVREAFPCKK